MTYLYLSFAFAVIANVFQWTLEVEMTPEMIELLPSVLLCATGVGLVLMLFLFLDSIIPNLLMMGASVILAVLGLLDAIYCSPVGWLIMFLWIINIFAAYMGLRIKRRIHGYR